MNKKDDEKTRQNVADAVTATGGSVVDVDAPTRERLGVSSGVQLVSVPSTVPDTQVYMTGSRDWLVGLPGWCTLTRGRLIAADVPFTTEALGREFDGRFASEKLAQLLDAYRLRGLATREGALRLGFKESRPTLQQASEISEIATLVIQLAGRP